MLCPQSCDWCIEYNILKHTLHTAIREYATSLKCLILSQQSAHCSLDNVAHQTVFWGQRSCSSLDYSVQYGVGIQYICWLNVTWMKENRWIIDPSSSNLRSLWYEAVCNLILMKICFQKLLLYTRSNLPNDPVYHSPVRSSVRLILHM